MIQVANLVIPLISFAYIANILGVSGLGKIAYFQTINTLACFLIDFGFTLSAARLVSVNLSNKLIIDSVYSNVQICRIIIWFLLTLISIIYFYFSNNQTQDLYILILAVVGSITSVFTPGWIFQAFTKNSILAVFSLVSRILSIIAIIYFVKNYTDIISAIYIQIVFSGLIAILSIMYIKYFLKVNIVLNSVNFFEIKRMYIEGYHTFIGFAFTLGHTYVNPLLIKFFLGDAALGLYYTAEKIVGVLKQTFYPISQAFYAQMCSLSVEKKYDLLIIKAKRIVLFFTGLCFISLLLNVVLGSYVYNILFGSEYDIINLISIMIVIQFIISIAIVLVNLLIVPLGESFILKRIYAIGLMIHLILVVPLIKTFELKGLLLSIAITEFVLTLFFLYYLYTFFKRNDVIG